MPVTRPYHHGNLRDAVLEAARTMVSKEGTAGLSLRALAREVGVSHPAIYNHFADREALLAELSTEALLTLGRNQRAALARATSPLDALERLAVAYFRFGVSDPARLRLAFTPEFSRASEYPHVSAAKDAAEQPALDAVTRACEAGLLPANEIPDRSVAMWALVHGFTVLAIDGRLAAGRIAVSGAGFAPVVKVLRDTVRRIFAQP